MNKLSSYLSMARRIRPLKAAPKILNYLKYRTRRRRATPVTGSYAPQIASLLLTMRCNLSCSFCNVANFMHDPDTPWQANEASLEKVQRIFSNPLFANCLLVDLLGGEPLLVKELVPIVAFLAQRGHLTSLTTNGMMLLDRISELKQAGISRISISIYETNWKVLVRDIKQINAVFPVHTNMVLFRRDVEQSPGKIIDTARYLRDAGCLDLRFWMYRPIGENPDPKEILFDADPAFVEFRRKMEESVPGFVFWPEPLKNTGIRKLCPQLWQRIGCDMQGNLGICCGTDEMLSGPEGNIFQGDPDTVWNHPELVMMRRGLLDPEAAPPERCRNCALLGDPGW